MIRWLLFLTLLAGIAVSTAFLWRTDAVRAPAVSGTVRASAPRAEAKPDDAALLRARLQRQGHSLAAYARHKGCSDRVGFLVDMSLHSGRNRFFIYDLAADTVLAAGLVAHGSCNMGGLADPEFSNQPGCGCSSLGRYKVGGSYAGRFGTAFKLHGLDSSNSNAFARYVVLHAYSCVPDAEIYPQPLCNSLGCPMVSYKFLETATQYIKRERKPVLLWIYGK